MRCGKQCMPSRHKYRYRCCSDDVLFGSMSVCSPLPCHQHNFRNKPQRAATFDSRTSLALSLGFMFLTSVAYPVHGFNARLKEKCLNSAILRIPVFFIVL
jgi:hypothetical protein